MKTNRTVRETGSQTIRTHNGVPSIELRTPLLLPAPIQRTVDSSQHDNESTERNKTMSSELESSGSGIDLPRGLAHPLVRAEATHDFTYVCALGIEHQGKTFDGRRNEDVVELVW